MARSGSTAQAVRSRSVHNTHVNGTHVNTRRSSRTSARRGRSGKKLEFFDDNFELMLERMALIAVDVHVQMNFFVSRGWYSRCEQMLRHGAGPIARGVASVAAKRPAAQSPVYPVSG